MHQTGSEALEVEDSNRQHSLKQRRVGELGFIIDSHYAAILVQCNLSTSNGRFHGVALFKDLVEFLKLSCVSVCVQ